MSFTQIVVWPGTIVGKDFVTEFENWVKTEFGVRAKYAEEVTTLPGQGGPGGRNDLFFYVHSDDISKFAVKRLFYGMRWWEDVIHGEEKDDETEETTNSIYPPSILTKYQPTW